MGLNDDAVIVGSQGFIYTNTPGAAAPLPSDLSTFDSETFGGAVKLAKITGAPTSYTLTVLTGTTSSLLAAATAAQVQAALEAVTQVGPGNVLVTGISIVDTDGLTITWIGELLGTAPVVTGTFTAGTSPALAYTTVTAANGWFNVGHTSRDDLPEFGNDGGKTKMKGSWQRKRLREVEDGDPREDSVKFSLEQWDRASLELYFGEDVADTSGVFGVSGDFNPIEKALLIVIVDGDEALGFYAPKASIQSDGAVKLPIDDFAKLPVKATFLNMGTRRLYDWIEQDLFA